MKKFQVDYKMQRTSEYLFLESRNIRSNECITFDFDGTLCLKANSDKFYTQENNENNFVFLYNVENKISSYISRGFHVVIITNQIYMTDAKENMLINVYNYFNKELSIYVANKENRFRKPNTGFYDLLSSRYNILYHCGNNSDIEFAKLCNIPFYYSSEIFGTNFYSIVPYQRLVIMMGIKGTGKSTIAKRLEEEHNFIIFPENSSLNKIKNALIENRVVVDGTHSNYESRQRIIDLCQDYIILWCIRKFDTSCYLSNYVKEFERPLENYVVIS